MHGAFYYIAHMKLTSNVIRLGLPGKGKKKILKLFRPPELFLCNYSSNCEKRQLFNINLLSPSKPFPTRGQSHQQSWEPSASKSRACRPLPSLFPYRTLPLGPYGSQKEPESPRSAAPITPPLDSTALCKQHAHGDRGELSLCRPVPVSISP